MDFPLNSSLVLAVAVGLWLLWVAPYLLGGTRAGASSRPPAASGPAAPRAAAAAAVLNRTADVGPSSRSTNPPAPPRPSQGISMNQASVHRPDTARAATGAPLRIRWGRFTLALIGAASLVAVPVMLVLAVAGVLAWWLPPAAAGLLTADLAVLRALAVRDRRRRVNRAFTAAMSTRLEPARAAAPAPAPQGPVQPAPAASAEPYDAEQDADEEPEPRLSAEELRSAALAEAVRSGNVAARPADTPWQPVELPKPSYVDAPKAERPAPAPLVLPEAPRPASKPGLRPQSAGAAAEGPVELVGTDSAAGESRSTNERTAAAQSQPATGILNLDDVLQRRRA